METIISRLKKIKVLAERGEAGEADVAKERLLVLLDKYGLSLKDLEEDKKTKYTFRYAFVDEKDLMLQCISKVTDDPKLSYSYRRDRKKEFYVELTEWQYVESKDLISFHIKQYRDARKKKMEAFKQAYLSRHRLFAESATGEGSKLSEEELDAILREFHSMDDHDTYTKSISE
jgi:hypothetical protein